MCFDPVIYFFLYVSNEMRFWDHSTDQWLSQDSNRVKIWSFQNLPLLLPSLWESFRELLPTLHIPQTREQDETVFTQILPALQWIICIFLLSSQPARQPPRTPAPRLPPLLQLALGTQRAERARGLGSRVRKLQLGWHWPALRLWQQLWRWLCALDAGEEKVSDPGPSSFPQDSQLFLRTFLHQNDQSCSVKMQIPSGPEVWAWESAFYLLRWYLCVIKFGTHRSRPIPLYKPDDFPVLVSWLNHFSSVSLLVPGEGGPALGNRREKEGTGRWLHSASTGWTPIFQSLACNWKCKSK